MNDAFPEILKTKRVLVTFITSLVLFLLALLCVTQVLYLLTMTYALPLSDIITLLTFRIHVCACVCVFVPAYIRGIGRYLLGNSNGPVFIQLGSTYFGSC